MARQALRAAAAEPREAGDDVVADAHRRDVGADRLDDAGAFVAEHDRPVERKAADAVDDVQVAVADAGRHRAHQHLAAQGLVDVDRLDGQLLLHLAEYGGLDLHGGSLLGSLRGFAEPGAPSSRSPAPTYGFGPARHVVSVIVQPRRDFPMNRTFGGASGIKSAAPVSRAARALIFGY